MLSVVPFCAAGLEQGFSTGSSFTCQDCLAVPEFPAVTYDGQWGGMLLASSGKCASCLTSCEVQVNLPQPSVMQPQSVASFEVEVP